MLFCFAFLSFVIVYCALSGTSAGYGFVKFSDDEGAAKSIAALNGFQLNGKTLKVSIARPMHQKNERTTLYVAGAKSLDFSLFPILDHRMTLICILCGWSVIFMVKE
jgi:RNA recognition motif-containing protein